MLSFVMNVPVFFTVMIVLYLVGIDMVVMSSECIDLLGQVGSKLHQIKRMTCSFRSSEWPFLFGQVSGVFCKIKLEACYVRSRKYHVLLYQRVACYVTLNDMFCWNK